MTDNPTTQKIRELNDHLRCTRLGGRVVITAGIEALGGEVFGRILDAVAAFNDFTADNDPHGEHDCAVMDVEGVRIIWKIDYYDEAFTYASPDPSDPSVTRRVLTVMLAEEY